MSSVAVIGIGAMGGGMARALLASPVTSTVSGFDRAETLVSAFHNEAVAVGKAKSLESPQSLCDAVDGVEFAILMLVNESQCETVCFGGKDNLLGLMQHGSCVILCSTVTATWARSAQTKFFDKGVKFVDCPISGGPARALKGELTMMASGDEDCLESSMPLLQAAGQEVHVISGGAGMGSTVKMVHQLLAGVHICCAAEALSLAAKAGVDVEQMYNIVNGAAGASWMFTDRGKRMVGEGEPDVMSALDIFVKDLDIVHSEAKALQCPIPVASASLQQFISGQSMGHGRKDDSQVVKVYESVTGISVGKKVAVEAPLERHERKGKSGTDPWKMEDGTKEAIVEVGNEPLHLSQISNDYVRAMKVRLPRGVSTCAHQCSEDILSVCLVEGGIDVTRNIRGSGTVSDKREFGEIRYDPHKSDMRPVVQTVTNVDDKELICIDAELLKTPPIVSAQVLDAENHELIGTMKKCRVYKLTLAAGESVTVDYPFFYLTIVLRGGTMNTEIAGGIVWEETSRQGDTRWKEPCIGIKQTNVGDSTYETFIAEWR